VRLFADFAFNCISVFGSIFKLFVYDFVNAACQFGFYVFDYDSSVMSALLKGVDVTPELFLYTTL